MRPFGTQPWQMKTGSLSPRQAAGLCELDFTEVIVVNPAHVKAIKGHKTDAKDCARLAELLECGLLHGSFIPSPEQRQVRESASYRPEAGPRQAPGWARNRGRRGNRPITDSVGGLA
jgi:hypothetical protein